MSPSPRGPLKIAVEEVTPFSRQAFLEVFWQAKPQHAQYSDKRYEALQFFLVDASLGKGWIIRVNGEVAGVLLIAFSFDWQAGGRIATLQACILGGLDYCAPTEPNHQECVGQRAADALPEPPWPLLSKLYELMLETLSNSACMRLMVPVALLGPLYSHSHRGTLGRLEIEALLQDGHLRENPVWFSDLPEPEGTF
ncbi:hypothetical protein [Polycladidibacter hongkongensis]|uniref:hypothetical protein n=1 Tax=Polycladidibacter hongkongensis TaxID=1647556 RepID=UPI000834771E|nr:hypothetical protein [Pseudovibrio hongkongensis]